MSFNAQEEDRFTVSVILWGGVKEGEDVPGHMGIGVHRSTSQPTVCHLHHARCPDQVRFIYESRPEQAFDADPAPRGRCDLRSDLSPEEASKANKAVTRFGADMNQLPFFGQGNCHNWTAGAVSALEEAGLAMPGDGEKWTAVIGKGPLAMETRWKEAGRQWVPCEKFSRAQPDVVDARWGQDAEVDAAKNPSGDGPEFKDRVARLQELLVTRNVGA